MILSDLLEEYIYDNLALGFTEKTIKNKRQEFKQFLQYMNVKRAITEIGINVMPLIK